MRDSPTGYWFTLIEGSPNNVDDMHEQVMPVLVNAKSWHGGVMDPDGDLLSDSQV